MTNRRLSSIFLPKVCLVAVFAMFAVAAAPQASAQCTLNPNNRTVTICTPANGATVTSPVHVVAGSTDSTPVKVMQIYLDGAKVYQVSGNTLDTSISASTGNHKLTVQAYDGSVYFKSSISITVSGTSGPCTLNTASPSVTICTPQNNATVTSPINVVAGTTDSKTVQFMQIYVDGVKVYQVSASSLNANISMSGGTHRLTVQAYDGTYFKSTVYVTVSSSTSCTLNTISPSVTICSPQNNATVTSPVNVVAGTTDPKTVQFMQIYVDGTKVYQVSASSLNTNVSMASGTHRLTVQAYDGTYFKSTIDVTVGTSGGGGGGTVAVLTYKYDNGRTGEQTKETILTPSNVNSTNFGKKFSFAVDGYVYAQPLYVPNLAIPNKGTHNVVFVATEHDSVYAFDADGTTTTPLWKRSFINPNAGITTVPQSDVSSTIYPEIGITGTPVIDLSSGTLYVDVYTKENSTYVHRLHALSITTGAEKFGGPEVISGSVAGTGNGSSGGSVAFQPMLELQRPALALANGNVYVAFGSHGDHGNYHGWIFAYSASTLARVAIWNVSPNANAGAIWEAGDGLVVDGSGNLYTITANGHFDAASGGLDYGDSFVKLSPGLSVLDYFTPFDQSTLAADDLDLGSGGAILIPGTSNLVGGGKQGRIYVVNKDGMGRFNSSSDGQIVQEIDGMIGPIFDTPAYWNGHLYFASENDSLKAFTVSNGKLSSAPIAQSSNTFPFPGTNPVVSANGTSAGIVWLIKKPSSGAGVLYAYAAGDVTNELYNSNQAGTRDQLPTAIKFSVPTIADGKVYIGAAGKLVVFGLLK